MVANPSIFAQIRQPEIASPMAQAGQMMTLQNLMNQGETSALQRRQMESTMAEDAAVKRAYAESGGDPNRLAQLLMQSSPKSYQQFQESQRKARLEDQEVKLKGAQTLKYTSEAQRMEMSAQRDALAQVSDEQSYQGWLQMLKPEGRSRVPPQFPGLEWRNQMVMTADDLMRKALQDEKNRFEGEQGDLNRGVQIRGQDITERGQTITDRRERDLSSDRLRVQVSEGDANRAIQVRGQNITDGRAREALAQAGWQYDSERGIAVNARSGETRTVTGSDGAPLGLKPNKPGETYLKQQTGVANTRNAITEYRAALAGMSPMDALTPNGRARIGTAYNNMMLQAKEAYNLGVLNGPDYMILQKVAADPTTAQGMLTSKSALDRQASELDRIMRGIGITAADVSGQPIPRPTQGPATQSETAAARPNAPRLGAVQDGFIYRGGDPSDRKSWERVSR